MIEVVSSEAPALRVQVPVHELFHYFFSRAPEAQREALAARFAGSADREALASYGLLDEVLATAFAQGVLASQLTPDELEKKLAAPRGLYADSFIDAVAKALLPALRQQLASDVPRGAVFSSAFEAEYRQAVRQAYPRGLPPAAQLRPLSCVYSKELERAQPSLQAAAGSPLVASSDEPDTDDARDLLEERVKWGRVLLLKSDRISALRRYTKRLLASDISAIHGALQSSVAFA